MELALAWAARAHGLQLGGYGQWKLPKMRYKGDSVVTQKLRLQRNEPVSCVRQCMTALAAMQGLLRTAIGWRVHCSRTGACAGGANTLHIQFLEQISPFGLQAFCLGWGLLSPH